MKRSFVAMFVCLALGRVLAAETKVDNPYYQSWEKAKEGTVVVMTDTIYVVGKAQDTFIRFTLKERKGDRVMVESKFVTADGVEAKDLRTVFPFFRQVGLPDNAGKDAAWAPASKAVAQGTEKVKINGRTYDTRIFMLTENVFGTEQVTTYWLTEEIPGLLLKRETKEKFAGKWTKTKAVQFKEIQLPR